MYKYLLIPQTELSFSFSCSGGPGGQNVNKTATKVLLQFDVLGSCFLSDESKLLLLEKLKSRINNNGVLQVSCQKHRSQHQNKQEVVTTFYKLMEGALRIQTERIATEPSTGSNTKRLRAKKQHSQQKAQRRACVEGDPQ